MSNYDVDLCVVCYTECISGAPCSKCFPAAPTDPGILYKLRGAALDIVDCAELWVDDMNPDTQKGLLEAVSVFREYKAGYARKALEF